MLWVCTQSVPENTGVSTLKETYNKKSVQKFCAESLAEIAELTVNNNCFKLNRQTL